MKTRVILTVGLNELPCLISAYRLHEYYRKKDGEAPAFSVLHSEDQPEAARIRACLEQKLGNAVDWDARTVLPYSPDNVWENVSDILRREPSSNLISLNYTGGTKAMAVHAMEALVSAQRNPELSYLTPDEHCLRGRNDRILGETDERIAWRFPGSDPQIESLARLHGATTDFFSTRSRPPERVQLASAPTDAELSDAVGNGFSFDPTDNNEPTRIELCVYSELGSALRELNFGNVPRWHSVRFARVGPGNRSKYECELDVVALFGYMLLTVSCTTTHVEKMIRQKAFEAMHHTRKLGGGLARGIVVCTVYESVARQLTEELADDSGGRESGVMVWGQDTLKNLKNRFVRYIRDEIRWKELP